MNARSTVSAVHAEDSSSASANFLILRDVKKQTSDGVYKLTPEKGSAFFLRTAYLKTISHDRLVPVTDGLGENDSLFVSDGCLKAGVRGIFNEEEKEELINAAYVFACETQAMSYLSRAEQCRMNLSKKLVSKGFSLPVIQEALDFLEQKDYLSDLRFAGAWLRNRYIDHAEGRRKLSAELAQRGISRENAKCALDEFFAEHNEFDLCKRAYKKYMRTASSVSDEKIFASLSRHGFSAANIKKVMKNAD